MGSGEVDYLFINIPITSLIFGECILTTKKTFVFDGEVIARSNLTTCGPSLSKSAGKDIKPVPVIHAGTGSFMYMPGSGTRSKLRGCATNIVRETLRKRGMKFLTLADAQLLRVGGIKQAGTEAALDTTERAEMLRKNPLLAIFGGSTPWVEGKLAVGNLQCKLPIEPGVFEPVIVDGVRADILRRDPEMVEFLTPDAIGEYTRTIANVKHYAKIKAEIADLKRRAFAAPDADTRKALRTQADKLVKDSKDQAIVSAQMPLSGYKAIPKGAVLDSALRLRNATSIELGCFLSAMNRFAVDPFIGAHIAHGAGEISGNWQVRVAGGGVIGSIELVPFVGLLIEDSTPEKPLATALSDFEKFMSTGDLEPWVNEAALIGVTEDSE